MLVFSTQNSCLIDENEMSPSGKKTSTKAIGQIPQLKHSEGLFSKIGQILGHIDGNLNEKKEEHPWNM